MEYAANLSLARSDKVDNGCTFHQAVDRLTEAGFTNLDLPFYVECAPRHRYGDTPFFSDGWRDWCLDLRNYAARKGARFTQTHSLIINYFDPACERLLPMLERVFEATALLGAKVTVMHPVAPPGLEGDTPACLERNLAFFARQADAAEAVGVTIAMENMLSTRRQDGTVLWRCCTGMDELCELHDRLDRPNVGICLDVGHAHYMGLPLDACVRQIGSRLIALHIHDNNRHDDQHLIPYMGTLDWESLYRGLRETRYAGIFTLEVLHASEKMPLALRGGFLKELRRLTEWMARQADGS